MLRLVFLLFAEERDLLSEDEPFVRHYSLAGLHDRLRADAALHPDTMDQRFGAWAQLLALFRMIHNGAKGARLRLPPRHGVLFDPDRYTFLEGRPLGAVAQNHERVKAPLVSDGTIHRALAKLLVLDGERLSYRALDVEHIGAVYETMMGFRLERAEGRSAAIKAAKKHGAPATVNLEALLDEAPSHRVRWLRERSDRNLTGAAAKVLRDAVTLDEIHAALDKVIDRDATPDLVRAGDLILQPSEERRRSGSHYTSRELTEPIVRDTLEPILDRLRREAADGAPPDLSVRGPSGPHPPQAESVAGAPATGGEPPPTPRPDRILDLKICDLAMGSGAFLVEACRQLADVLADSWLAHDAVPAIPPDEDETVHARRLVARNCLYGVDRNPVAVDLAKLSLWLVTLARDHPLTFLDHALREGDSLVGLNLEQIQALHWKGGQALSPHGEPVVEVLERTARTLRVYRRPRPRPGRLPSGRAGRLRPTAQRLGLCRDPRYLPFLHEGRPDLFDFDPGGNRAKDTEKQRLAATIQASHLLFAPLGGGDLYVTERDLADWCDAVIQFWRGLAAALRKLHSPESEFPFDH